MFLRVHRERRALLFVTSRGFATRSNVIVQKFGGTSLGTTDRMRKVANIVKQFHNENSSVVAVVSALSSETKAEGTTSRLLGAAEAAVTKKEFHPFIDAIENTHKEVISGLLKSGSLREDAESYLEGELGRLRAFCESLAVIREISPRSHDMVIGAGERLSAHLLSCVLKEDGLESENVDLSYAFYNGGLDCSKKGYPTLAKEAFLPLLKNVLDQGKIPVVTGFFGHVKGGIIKDVGRGYTDLTSALCAGALKAKQLQVWKESDGVFTGNPTKIESARLINLVTPAEASELTAFGNEVLHPFTMGCAIEDDVPISILNTFKPDGLGTRIASAGETDLQNRPGSHGVAAICSKNDIRLLSISNTGKIDAHTYFLQIFKAFADHKVKTDLISTSMHNLTVTLHESNDSANVEAVVNDINEFARCELETEKAIVSCVGSGMRHQAGVAATAFEALSAAGISLEMISQGASEINISAVIESKDQNKAIHVLHERFME